MLSKMIQMNKVSRCKLVFTEGSDSLVLRAAARLVSEKLMICQGGAVKRTSIRWPLLQQPRQWHYSIEWS